MSLVGKKIFIVEDDPNNLAIVSSILRRQGASVYFDLWGRGTMQRIISLLPVDMILMDLMLPQGVSGYDVVEGLHEIPELREIPVIALTAMDPATEVKKARDLGFSGFICKPIRTKTFVEILDAILDGQKVWVELE